MTHTKTIGSKQAEAFLKELNLDTLKGKEREEALAMLEKRFDDVIMNTVLASLSDEGFEAFKTALQSQNSEEEIAKVTAQVPGLAAAIEERLLIEYDLMKSVFA